MFVFIFIYFLGCEVQGTSFSGDEVQHLSDKMKTTRFNVILLRVSIFSWKVLRLGRKVYYEFEGNIVWNGCKECPVCISKERIRENFYVILRFYFYVIYNFPLVFMIRVKSVPECVWIGFGSRNSLQCGRKFVNLSA